MEAVDPSFHLSRHGSFLKLQLSGVHHRPVAKTHTLNPGQTPVRRAERPHVMSNATPYRRIDKLFAPMSWQPCWMPAMR